MVGFAVFPGSQVLITVSFEVFTGSEVLKIDGFAVSQCSKVVKIDGSINFSMFKDSQNGWFCGIFRFTTPHNVHVFLFSVSSSK